MTDLGHTQTAEWTAAADLSRQDSSCLFAFAFKMAFVFRRVHSVHQQNQGWCTECTLLSSQLESLLKNFQYTWLLLYSASDKNIGLALYRLPCRRKMELGGALVNFPSLLFFNAQARGPVIISAIMKTLWTPWRIEHVLGNGRKTGGCLFEPVGNTVADKRELLLYRDEEVIVLLNRFPYSNGHLLVAPVRHVGCITELTPKENRATMAMVQKATAILGHHLRPDGFNIGCNIGSIAGAGIADHLHFHIVPRWQGDHNFMAVLAELRTIPEHIEATFDRLAPDFLALLQK
jgi:ATP adenylyltransferase